MIKINNIVKVYHESIYEFEMADDKERKRN